MNWLKQVGEEEYFYFFFLFVALPFEGILLLCSEWETWERQ